MDPLRENFALRWTATPVLWRIVLLGSILGVMTTVAIPPIVHPTLPLAVLRALFGTAALVAAVINKRVADEFYLRVYAQASVFAIVLSAVVYFASSQYVFDFAFSGAAALTILVASWWVGFAIAFFRNSR